MKRLLFVSLLLGCACNRPPLAASAPSEDALIRRIEASMVTVHVSRVSEGVEESHLGSGTVIASGPSGSLVLTCAHVFGSALPGRVTVVYGGKETDATLDSLDGDKDLAAVIVPFVRLPPLPIALTAPGLYERLFLMGSPLGFPGAVTVGWLNNLGEKIPLHQAPVWRITGGLLAPGISGGAAVTARGELACVPEVTYTKADGQLGWCVGLPEIREFVRAYGL